jgi:hypothetical protein
MVDLVVIQVDDIGMVRTVAIPSIQYDNNQVMPNTWSRRVKQ